MSAFVSPDFLPLNLFVTNPAAELLLQFFQDNGSKSLENEFVIASRTHDHIGLLFHFINIIWSIIESPESSFDIIIFFRIEFIHSYRLNFFCGDRSDFLFMSFPLNKCFAVGDLHKTIIFFKGFQFTYLLFQLLLLLLILYSFLSSIYFGVILCNFLFLFH